MSGTNEKQDANKKMKDDRRPSFQSQVVLFRSNDRFGFKSEYANSTPTTANLLLDVRSKSARIATFSSNVHNAGRKLGCFFEKMDNFSLILPNFSKKVHHFFAKGVKNEHKQNGDLCQHGVRSPKKGD